MKSIRIADIPCSRGLGIVRGIACTGNKRDAIVMMKIASKHLIEVDKVRKDLASITPKR
jgi:hypothetical protein